MDQIGAVDVYVPGCPPRPAALWEGILAMQKKLTGRRFWPVPKPVEDPERDFSVQVAEHQDKAAKEEGEGK